MRRPFNALAEGLVSENSRDDKTAVETFPNRHLGMGSRVAAEA
jgi:hypothetical protein